MKTFKGYLTEREGPAWLKSASDMAFRENLMIPVSTPIFNRIFGGSLRTTVFHITTPANINATAKLQGKKKSLSAFTVADPKYYSEGIASGGGVVFEIEADVLISAPQDLMSQPDKTGRRWLEPSYLERSMRSAISRDAYAAIAKLVKKYGGPRVSGPSAAYEWSKMRPIHTQSTGGWGEIDDGANPTMTRKEAGRLLQKMIADYIDAMEGVMSKNAKPISDYYRNVIDRKMSIRHDGSWNEMVVNNINIKKVMLTRDRILNDSATNVGYFAGDEDAYENWKMKLARKFTITEFPSAYEMQPYIRKVNAKMEGQDR